MRSPACTVPSPPHLHVPTTLNKPRTCYFTNKESADNYLTRHIVKTAKNVSNMLAAQQTDLSQHPAAPASGCMPKTSTSNVHSARNICTGKRNDSLLGPTCGRGNTEIDETPALAVKHEEKISWLDVPVHHARAVHVDEAACQIEHQVQDRSERSPRVAAQPPAYKWLFTCPEHAQHDAPVVYEFEATQNTCTYFVASTFGALAW